MAGGKHNQWGFSKTNLRDPETGELYMTRWVFQTPWFGIRVHKIWRSDNERDMHDHPFDFTSFILWGGYTEWTPNRYGLWDDCAFYGPGSVLRRKAEQLHYLTLKRPAWTLVFAGPYRREWGFQTKYGWVPAAKYHRSFYEREKAP